MYKPKSENYSTSETDGPLVSQFRRRLQRLLSSTVKNGSRFLRNAGVYLPNYIGSRLMRQFLRNTGIYLPNYTVSSFIRQFLRHRVTSHEQLLRNAGIYPPHYAVSHLMKEFLQNASYPSTQSNVS